MTTEDDFQRALDANPEDWQTRLVFADWLQDRGDPRAAGYRLLGMARRIPQAAMHHGGALLWWWSSERLMDDAKPPARERLPVDWFDAITGHGDSPIFKPLAEHAIPNTRREMEDTAAIAFASLPAQRQAELLEGAESAE